MSERSKSEARAFGKKGGKASGAARREKKTMREYADFLLSLEVQDGRRFNKLVRAGVPMESCDNKMLVVFGLMQAAQAGEVAAIKELRGLIGEDTAHAGAPESNLLERIAEAARGEGDYGIPEIQRPPEDDDDVVGEPDDA